ncbi:hypothetical protein ACFLQQ_02880 [Actinomycetota bacterium]
MLLLSSCTQDPEISNALPAGQNSDNGELYLFDYKRINIESTSSIGAELKNCNVYLDLYGDLIILGELENTSPTTKTDIEITLSFISRGGDNILETVIPVIPNYLKSGAKYPFHYYFGDRQKYIEISTIKVGLNYKEYNKNFKGNPIVEIEDYFYRDESLIIQGRVINLGREKIKNLKLICTFYSDRDKVVFIKECYLTRVTMMPSEKQVFTLEVLLDEYLEEFTHYNFEIFFEDEIRVSA